MRKLSIRMKITLWFSVVMVFIVALTYGVIFSVSNSIIQKAIQDNLIETIENNVDEIEYYDLKSDIDKDNDVDQYIIYGAGYLEIDDDFLDQVNGISSALYDSQKVMLYGENPISKEIHELAFLDSKVRKRTVDGTVWYVYDRKLTAEGLEKLWIRGVVSVETQSIQLSSIIQISMFLLPLLLFLAVIGGYFIAGRSLKPMHQIVETVSQINQGQDLKKRIGLGVGEDELHQLADAFDAMFDRLDVSFEMERQFTSDASHELRTPMAVIMAQCEYTLSQDSNPEEYVEALRVIQLQGGKMTRLINDMLTFTRMHGKTTSYEMCSLEFSSLITAVCEDLALIADKNIQLTAQVEDAVFVRGNRELLTRLLNNLISNAYRYGRENGHINVVLASQDQWAKLSVIDDGIGIAKEEQEKIFRRFYQISSARSNAGSGLGLSMVKEIAGLHHGTISVESIPQEGSTFTFTIKKL